MTVQGRVKSVKALVQAMSMDTPGAAHIDLGSESLNLNRGLRDKGDVDGLVLRAWPAGCTVSGGTINLPRCSVLLLTGRGVHFKGTSFCGAALHAPGWWPGITNNCNPVRSTVARCAEIRSCCSTGASAVTQANIVDLWPAGPLASAAGQPVPQTSTP